MPVRIGDVGTAVSSLHPQGVIEVAGRRYSARAQHEALEAGSEVVVVMGDLTGLVVRKARLDAPLADAGKAVHSSFADKIEQRAERDTRELRAVESRRRHHGFLGAGILGLAVSAVCLWIVWGYLTEEPGPTGTYLACTLAGGALLGAAVYWNFSHLLSRFDRSGGHISELCTIAALLGGGVGAAIGIPAFGLVEGLALALVCLFAAGLALPMLLVVGEDVGGG